MIKKEMLIGLALLAACQTTNTNNAESDTATTESANVAESISPERTTVKTEAVASYESDASDELNKWKFKVQLFETKSRFSYLLRMQYQEILGEDTLRIPNLGVEPKVELKPGSGKNSCIIGFLDKEGVFREYKEVSIKNDNLKVTTLKHYAVYTQ